jgi:hypothetical protein
MYTSDNMTFKRDKIKYIRDRAKARYEKGTHCRICDTTHELEFHHYYSLTPLFNKWIADNNISLETEEDILNIRDEFIEKHKKELYDEAVTLCKTHHMKLHSIYGKDPLLSSAMKQKRWVDIQREKNGLT